MDEDLKYIRDMFAMFAMMGLINEIKGIYEPQQMEKLTNLSYGVADAMLIARNKKENYAEEGIAGISKRKYTRKMED